MEVLSHKWGIISLICFALCAVVSGAPEYQFTFGRITGADELAQETQRPYYAYYGIPFAQPPVGSLRFRSPQPFSNQNNPNRVISSSSFKPACIQFGEPLDKSSEDCLYLNVYSPPSVNTGGALKKVMVWIHGGGYLTGSAKLYIPSRMVTDYDVIVVTVQYRLGLLGFVNPGAGQETNFGLRDQIMAIQWVKDNIRQFGGDDNDITIFGESAGSSSVSLLSLSPLAKGLFTKVIMQSGVANSFFATLKDSKKSFQNLVNYAGCNSWLYRLSTHIRDAFIDDVMACLRKKSASEIMFSSPVFRSDDKNGLSDSSTKAKPEVNLGQMVEYVFDSDLSIAPSVDGVVIPRDPESLLADKAYLKSNGVLDRTYMVGFNNNEGLLALGMVSSSPGGGSLIDYSTFEKPEQAEAFVKAMTKQLFPLPVSDDVMDFVVYEYTYPRGYQDKTDFANTISIYSDVLFTISTVQFARALNKASETTPVYMYLFDHYPELIDPSAPMKGSTHALDLNFEFDRNPGIDAYLNFYAKLGTATDQPMYNVFRSSLTDFAKTGVPSSQEYSSWPRFQPKNEFYMSLSKNPEVRERVFAKKVDLWTKILPKKASQSFGSRRMRFY